MHKILVIEDDKYLRELILKKFSMDQDFNAISANDGESGIEVCKKEKPDLILLDLILPGIDGFEVLKRIKQDEELSLIPVIILSNLGQKSDIEKGEQLGAADYMVKAHFTPNEIIDKVRQTLAK